MSRYVSHGTRFSFQREWYIVSGLKSLGDGDGDCMRVVREDGEPIPDARDTGDGTTLGLSRALERAAEKALTRSANFRDRS